MVIFGFLMLGMAIGAMTARVRGRALIGPVLLSGFAAMAGGVFAALLRDGPADLSSAECWIAAGAAGGLAVAAEWVVSRELANLSPRPLGPRS